MQAQPNADFSLEAKVGLLKTPGTYPESPTRVDSIETHMSWVFLTDRHAYKLKKPVRYPYLDFSSLTARERYCREEYRLNQWLAPGVYLGVVPLAVDDTNTAHLEGEGRVVEWLVKMRRLPENRMLDQLIKAGRLAPVDVASVAGVLVGFYREATPLMLDVNAHRGRLSATIARNRDVLATPSFGFSAEQLHATFGKLSAFLRNTPEVFDRRIQEGRMLEGHGDLRPEHICLESRPVVFDRLEFNRDLRIIDPADELAFLSMECERLGAAFVRDVLFETYGSATGDRPLQTLKNFYTAHRACLRARLAALHTVDAPPLRWPHWLDVASDYLRIAAAYAGRLPHTATDSSRCG